MNVNVTVLLPFGTVTVNVLVPLDGAVNVTPEIYDDAVVVVFEAAIVSESSVPVVAYPAVDIVAETLALAVPPPVAVTYIPLSTLFNVIFVPATLAEGVTTFVPETEPTAESS